MDLIKALELLSFIFPQIVKKCKRSEDPLLIFLCGDSYIHGFAHRRLFADPQGPVIATLSLLASFMILEVELLASIKFSCCDFSTTCNICNTIIVRTSAREFYESQLTPLVLENTGMQV